MRTALRTIVQYKFRGQLDSVLTYTVARSLQGVYVVLLEVWIPGSVASIEREHSRHPSKLKAFNAILTDLEQVHAAYTEGRRS